MRNISGYKPENHFKIKYFAGFESVKNVDGWVLKINESEAIQQQTTELNMQR